MDFFTYIYAFIQKGGFVMYPLIICSVFVIAIAVERWLYYRQAETGSDFNETLTSKLSAGQWQEADELCRSCKGVVPALILQALSRKKSGQGDLQNVLEGAATVAAARLRERLDYLETIVTLAPLLGLLGTVLGMINSFSVMAIKSGQPHAITGGVGEALVATATGLGVAIMALLVHSYFAHRVNSMITVMEEASNVLLDAAERGRQCENT